MEKKKTKKVTRHKLQKFEMVEIDRGQIKEAPYNPRQIDDYAMEKLTKKIKKKGLIIPLCWNKKTGNLVGGHVRLRILDSTSKDENYKLTVAVVNLSLQDEKELNVFLNNNSAQGEFDLDLLKDIIKDDTIDISGLGFDKVDLEMLYENDSDISTLFKESKEVEKDIENFSRMSGRIKDKKEALTDEEDSSHNLIIVFPEGFSREQFLKGLKLPTDTLYVDGKRLAKDVGIKIIC